MILYISSHQYNQPISEAITSCNKNILNAIVEAKLSLNNYIKKQLDQFQSVDTFIVELSCLTDNDEEIIQALNNFRLLYNHVKIIVISPIQSQGTLLSEIFGLGIYDIIISSGEQLVNDIKYSLTEGMTYKDSINFKIDTSTSTDPIRDTSKVKIKEKIVIKNEVIQTANKALIGFIGSTQRIGVTHNAIVSAHILKNNGFKVALVENQKNENRVFDLIREDYESNISSYENYFTLNQIDFYSNYDLSEVYKVLAKNYNFVIVDFGIWNPEYLDDFNRCIKPIVVCGSKSWELSSMNNIFRSTSEEILKEFYYLFNFTDLAKADELKESMGVLSKIFFTDLVADPFNSIDSPSLKMLFKEYLPSENRNSNKRKGFRIGGKKFF